MVEKGGGAGQRQEQRCKNSAQREDKNVLEMRGGDGYRRV